MKRETEGYVLVGIGEDYVNLCKNLIHTLRMNGDEREVFVLTEPDKDSLFNSARTEFERFGTIPKITLNRHLPFDHNIFLDADSLCASNTDHVWEWVRSNDQFIQQLGTEVRDSKHFPMDAIHRYERELGFTIPKVHGGFIYLNKNKIEEEFFIWMQEVAFPQYGKILHSTPLSYKRSRPDQEIFSLAHGKFGLKVWEIWDHPIITVARDVKEFPMKRVLFGKAGDINGPEFDIGIPFIHVFKGKYASQYGESGGTKYHMPHYGEMYNNIMNGKS